ncbi:hypothetical protein [Amycolatopsis sp. CA-230715]|nr:hypothetical protein [Amycolatopsis sp. CA-230715]
MRSIRLTAPALALVVLAACAPGGGAGPTDAGPPKPPNPAPRYC